ncbi:arginine deiminase-related protein [Sulfitobacter sp. AS92]|uniref:arginine deiminase-related protein n=1 Tax=Sulfitobacter sp. AS92 TaxID=3135783 RepID=UPI00318138F8
MRRDAAERLRRGERDIVDLTHAQIAEFAGNAIELQGRDGLVLALSTRALRSLDTGQRQVLERHIRLLPLDIPTIEHAGSSVRCMIAGLHLSARPQITA